MIIPQGHVVRPVHCDELPRITDVATFRGGEAGRFVVEPEGLIELPPSRVEDSTESPYHPDRTPVAAAVQKLPESVHYPAMQIGLAQNALCVPFGPPLLQDGNQVVADYLAPHEDEIGDFYTKNDDGFYSTKLPIDTGTVDHDLPVALYLDHPASGDFGHFTADCMPRLYAMEVCRALFGEVKVVLAHSENAHYQAHMLEAAGVPPRDIVRLRPKEVARCRRLLMPTNALRLERYASPTSARLWGSLRDRSARRDISMPDRVYLSGTSPRKLQNAAEVEHIFECLGFKIIQPGTLRVETLISLIANALLVAGACGSGMFSLAFQGRMRSAFMLVPDDPIQITEMLMCAERCCSLRYLVGVSVPGEAHDRWTVDLQQLETEISEWLRTGT
jgi:capsular polysaccharide biosynthesis protein